MECRDQNVALRRGDGALRVGDAFTKERNSRASLLSPIPSIFVGDELCLAVLKLRLESEAWGCECWPTMVGGLCMRGGQ